MYETNSQELLANIHSGNSNGLMNTKNRHISDWESVLKIGKQDTGKFMKLKNIDLKEW